MPESLTEETEPLWPRAVIDERFRVGKLQTRQPRESKQSQVNRATYMIEKRDAAILAVVTRARALDNQRPGTW